MPNYLPYVLHENQFLISAERVIFWENEQLLILSDLHFGKTGHFRKSGIAIPQSVMMEDLQRLFSQIQYYKPKKLIIVGDLFHSDKNKELDLFLRWRHDLPHLEFHLVKGNHDILKRNWYQEAGIEVHPHALTIGSFSFMHDINDCPDDEQTYCFSGHIHPGIIVKGGGRQALQLACYYFGKKHAVLPAFGKFTGSCVIEPEKGAAVFALVGKEVMRIKL